MFQRPVHMFQRPVHMLFVLLVSVVLNGLI